RGGDDGGGGRRQRPAGRRPVPGEQLGRIARERDPQTERGRRFVEALQRLRVGRLHGVVVPRERGTQSLAHGAGEREVVGRDRVVGDRDPVCPAPAGSGGRGRQVLVTAARQPPGPRVDQVLDQVERGGRMGLAHAQRCYQRLALTGHTVTG